MKHFVFALLICLPFVSWAQSGYIDPAKSGNDYLRLCQSSSTHNPSPQDDEICVFWMQGVNDGFRAYEELSHVRLFDAPDDVMVGQLGKIVTKFMISNPEMLHERTATLVLLALQNAYPVKQPVKK